MAGCPKLELANNYNTPMHDLGVEIQSMYYIIRPFAHGFGYHFLNEAGLNNNPRYTIIPIPIRSFYEVDCVLASFLACD